MLVDPDFLGLFTSFAQDGLNEVAVLGGPQSSATVVDVGSELLTSRLGKARSWK